MRGVAVGGIVLYGRGLAVRGGGWANGVTF